MLWKLEARSPKCSGTESLSPKFTRSVWKGCHFHNIFCNVCSSKQFCFWSGAGWVCGSPAYASVNSNYDSEVTIYCTLLALQICFLLSEKSMRSNPPPWARAIFRGSRSSCTIPTLWRSCTNLYTWYLQEIMYRQWQQLHGHDICCLPLWSA